MATDDEVAGIAVGLYAGPLSGFTADRTARAKAARSDGDRDLAARIGALPKPSGAAWLVDLLAREHGDELDRVADLGARLREAQEDPDRNRLRALAAERRTMLAEVTAIAADRSEEAGRRASAAVLEEVQQTLQAALTSEDAAAAIRSGRLVRALTSEGLDPVDLGDAVAVGGLRSAPPKATPQEVDEDADARRKTAEDRVAEAEHAATDARAAADRARSEAEAAGTAVMQRSAEADRLRRDLEALRQKVQAAEDDLAAAEDAADAAARAADRARDEADSATAALRDLAAG